MFLYFHSIHFSLEVNDKSASRDIRIIVSITFIVVSWGRFLNFVNVHRYMMAGTTSLMDLM